MSYNFSDCIYLNTYSLIYITTIWYRQKRKVYKQAIITTIHPKVVTMKCKTCEYAWETRIDNPKSCPRCKRRFDYSAVKVLLAEAA